MRFWSKLFKTRHEIVIAICDEGLIDKEIESRRGIKLSKHFYGGTLIDERGAVKAMEAATIGNLFGKNIVRLAEKHGFVSKENVIFIKGIPHAQFAKLLIL